MTSSHALTLTINPHGAGGAPMVADNIARFSGAIVDHYAAARPSPPLELRSLLVSYATQALPVTTPATGTPAPVTATPASVASESKSVKVKLVIDLGCGTGLSTFFWRGIADRVIGVEPNGDMLFAAKTQLAASIAGGNDNSGTTIEFVQAIASTTGLPSGCADIVTCSQALHWMEPVATFAEVRRLLRPGGVFAAFDNDWPPSIPSSWQLEKAFADMCLFAKATGDRLNVHGATHAFIKENHLSFMISSGHFRYCRELLIGRHDTGNGDRLVDLALSQGHVSVLHRRLTDWTSSTTGVTASDNASAPSGTISASHISVAPAGVNAADELRLYNDSVTSLRNIARDHQPSSLRIYEWYWNYRVRLAIV